MLGARAGTALSGDGSCVPHMMGRSQPVPLRALSAHALSESGRRPEPGDGRSARHAGGCGTAARRRLRGWLRTGRCGDAAAATARRGSTGHRRGGGRCHRQTPAASGRRPGGGNPRRVRWRTEWPIDGRRPSSRIVQASTAPNTRWVPLHGSRPRVARTAASDPASTARATRCSSDRGPPRMTNPESTSPSMKAACAAHPDCSSSASPGSQLGPLRWRMTRKMATSGSYACRQRAGVAPLATDGGARG